MVFAVILRVAGSSLVLTGVLFFVHAHLPFVNAFVFHLISEYLVSKLIRLIEKALAARWPFVIWNHPVLLCQCQTHILPQKDVVLNQPLEKFFVFEVDAEPEGSKDVKLSIFFPVFIALLVPKQLHGVFFLAIPDQSE